MLKVMVKDGRGVVSNPFVRSALHFVPHLKVNTVWLDDIIPTTTAHLIVLATILLG